MSGARQPAGVDERGGQFAATTRLDPGSDVLGGDAPSADVARDSRPESGPPTKYDVEDARLRLTDLGPRVRPMYRPDWERVNGGRGPTVQQARDETRSRSESNNEIRTARAEYEQTRAAYEASDKTQDDRLVQCGGRGTRFDELDGSCPTCGQQ